MAILAINGVGWEVQNGRQSTLHLVGPITSSVSRLMCKNWCTLMYMIYVCYVNEVDVCDVDEVDKAGV